MESGQYEKATGKLPDWWDKCPLPVRGDDFYLLAFWELSSCRNFSGMGIGPIPWHHVLEYGRWKQLDPGMLVLFIQVIRELDEVYLKDLNDKQRQESDRHKRQPKQNG